MKVFINLKLVQLIRNISLLEETLRIPLLGMLLIFKQLVIVTQTTALNYGMNIGAEASKSIVIGNQMAIVDLGVRDNGKRKETKQETQNYW